MKDDADGASSRPSPSEPVVLPPLVRQLVEAVWAPEGLSQRDVDLRFLSANQRMRDIKPSGPIESMLAVQMVATHEAALECLRRAMSKDQSFEGRDLNLKHATKLMGIYERQVAALNKHRGRGQQHVTVKHVHVAEGGQAIVGNVTRSGAAEIAKAEPPPALQAPSELPLEVPPERQKVRSV